MRRDKASVGDLAKKKLVDVHKVKNLGSFAWWIPSRKDIDKLAGGGYCGLKHEIY